MATRKKKETTTRGGVREAVRRAREAGHDTLGLMSDPKTRGALEFTNLVQTLTERLAATFEKPVAADSTGAGAVAAASVARAVGSFVWEPVARCIVRAMIRTLCGRATRLRRNDPPVPARCSDDDLRTIGISAIQAVRGRLGDALRDDQVVGAGKCVGNLFASRALFAEAVEFRNRGVPHAFRRDHNHLIVTRGGA